MHAYTCFWMSGRGRVTEGKGLHPCRTPQPQLPPCGHPPPPDGPCSSPTGNSFMRCSVILKFTKKSYPALLSAIGTWLPGGLRNSVPREDLVQSPFGRGLGGRNSGLIRGVQRGLRNIQAPPDDSQRILVLRLDPGEFGWGIGILTGPAGRGSRGRTTPLRRVPAGPAGRLR